MREITPCYIAVLHFGVYLIAKQTVEHILGIDRKNRIITQQQNLD